METLTDRIRIFSLLKRLKDERSLLGIGLEGSEADAFNSAIIDVSLDHNYFILDELKPKAGHRLLLARKRCHIKGQTQGIHLEFDARLGDTGEEKGVAYYVCPIPESMDYQQRRASVRINVGAANPLPVSLKNEEGLVLEGELKDLSAGGIGVRLRKDLPPQIEPGQRFECRFPCPMDAKEHFVCDIEIRLAKPKTDAHEPAFLGCQFLDLVKQQERQLDRMVMALQRLAQKRRSDK